MHLVSWAIIAIVSPYEWFCLLCTYWPIAFSVLSNHFNCLPLYKWWFCLLCTSCLFVCTQGTTHVHYFVIPLQKLLDTLLIRHWCTGEKWIQWALFSPSLSSIRATWNLTWPLTSLDLGGHLPRYGFCTCPGSSITLPKFEVNPSNLKFDLTFDLTWSWRASSSIRILHSPLV